MNGFIDYAKKSFDNAGRDFFPLALLILGLAIALLIYFLPTFVAAMRSHQNTLAIFVLNITLGWTFLGWAIALVWACTQVTQKENKSLSANASNPSLLWTGSSMYPLGIFCFIVIFPAAFMCLLIVYPPFEMSQARLLEHIQGTFCMVGVWFVLGSLVIIPFIPGWIELNPNSLRFQNWPFGVAKEVPLNRDVCSRMGVTHNEIRDGVIVNQVILTIPDEPPVTIRVHHTHCKNIVEAISKHLSTLANAT